MNKKIIKEWLSDIATPTGISYSGDQTISESMAEKIVDYVSNLEQALDENNKLKIQLSARETLCEEYEQLINTILNFPFFKEECPLNFGFEDNSKEDKAQNIFYNDEYCENNCNDNYKDCWLKYFKELQKAKGDD